MPGKKRLKSSKVQRLKSSKVQKFKGSKVMKLATYRPTYAEINLSAIKHNFYRLRKFAGSAVNTLAAVKADAYGHGIEKTAKLLASCGVNYFGVGTVDEGIKLKKLNLKIPVLNLTAVSEAGEITGLLRYKIIQTVPDAETANAINTAAGRLRWKVKVHLKIDTGMGRLGVWHKEAVDFIKYVYSLKNLVIEGLFTHFSNADEEKNN